MFIYNSRHRSWKKLSKFYVKEWKKTQTISMHKPWLSLILIDDCDKIKALGQENIFALSCLLPKWKPRWQFEDLEDNFFPCQVQLRGTGILVCVDLGLTSNWFQDEKGEATSRAAQDHCCCTSRWAQVNTIQKITLPKSTGINL